MGEVIFLSILEMIGIIAFFLAFSFPTSIIDKSGGPSFFPQSIVGFLTFFVLIRIISILRTGKQERSHFHFAELFHGACFVYLVVTLLAIVLMRLLGFIIDMSLYLSFLILYLYEKQTDRAASLKWKILVCMFSVAGSVLIDYLFCAVMKVVIPKGILGF